jgi:hypothetical protein
MAEIVVIEGLEYTKSNHRLRYNPEFHENHGLPFTREDKIYMCSMWDSTPKADIAMALGKTLGTVLSKKYNLKKQGLFGYYEKLGKEQQ